MSGYACKESSIFFRIHVKSVRVGRNAVASSIDHHFTSCAVLALKFSRLHPHSLLSLSASLRTFPEASASVSQQTPSSARTKKNKAVSVLVL